MTLLNLGCGHRLHPAWINVDYVATEAGVMAYDLMHGIPFSDESVDVVYHSHFLEHLSRAAAETFVHECFRVLRPQGLLRVVVPDLENVVRAYLAALEKVSDGSQAWSANYDWLLLEMLDQFVRETQGGEMQIWLVQAHLPNKEFVMQRCGTEVAALIERGRSGQQTPQSRTITTEWRKLLRFSRYPHYLREILLRLALGKEYHALQIGRFRKSGETHQWMYDRFSLERLLRRCGFEQIQQKTPTESDIPNWATFHLDVEPDGAAYKPNSLYMEAMKPA